MSAHTDRELLELAAQAAGIKLHVWGTPGAENFADMDAAPYGKLWNPLTDDGDALRLAVKLGLKIQHHDDSVVVWADYIGTGFIPYDGDPCAATRRAIVLGAVEAGAPP